MSARSSASVTDATERMRACKAPPRLEVRIWPHDNRWEVLSGDEGRVHRFVALDAAMHCEHELARRAWADHGQLSCVKLFAGDTWDVVAVFGVAPPPARVPWVPSFVG
jgi:hypothetical protein